GAGGAEGARARSRAHSRRHEREAGRRPVRGVQAVEAVPRDPWWPGLVAAPNAMATESSRILVEIDGEGHGHFEQRSVVRWANEKAGEESGAQPADERCLTNGINRHPFVKEKLPALAPDRKVVSVGVGQRAKDI